MSAIEAVKAELEQKRVELVALHEKYDATIKAGRDARWIVETGFRDVTRLERALSLLEEPE